jgi:hypothetical protein
MANEVNKAILSPNRLQTVFIPNDATAIRGNYYIRYRVVSEDRNRNSAWSPIYAVPAPTVSEILANNSQSVTEPIFSTQTLSGQLVIDIIWNKPTALDQISEYYLYLRWGVDNSGVIEYGDWEYFKSVQDGSIQIVRPVEQAGATYVSVLLQTPTYPKQPFAPSEVFLLEDKAI